MKSRSTPIPIRQLTRLVAGLSALVVMLCLGLTLAGPAAASQTQDQILEADGNVLQNPAATLLQARQLGFNVIRMMLYWQDMAPRPNSFTAPANFNASNPAAYPASAWTQLDAADRVAAGDGIQLDFDVMGGAPIWATGPNMPKGTAKQGYPYHAWEPNAVDYGAFVKAVATRYSGNYDPVTNRLAHGNAADLPRVSFWSLWNEPDYGPSLSPQAVPHSKSVPEAPRLLRALLQHGWSALASAGHTTATDTIIWGELAPRGELTFGNFDGMLPLPFLRYLYCVNGSYQPLRGKAAAAVGCPTTAAGSASFAAQNPALFKASGVSDHPYMRWYSPNKEQDNPKVKDFSQLVKQYTSLGTISQLTSALNRLTAAYHVHVKLPVWDTEFGYITSPPKRIWAKDHYPYASTSTAAYYDNWAEYLSWKNPQIASFDQYLLYDPEQPTQANDYGGYASGLMSWNGVPKTGFYAFRMPLYLPNQTASSPYQPIEVWGSAKPSSFAQLDAPGLAESVTLLFKPLGSSSYSILTTIPITSPQGYYDQRIAFPSSGTLVAQWTYPPDQLLQLSGTAIYSRPVQVTVK
jgi:hypothetical protein